MLTVVVITMIASGPEDSLGTEAGARGTTNANVASGLCGLHFYYYNSISVLA